MYLWPSLTSDLPDQSKLNFARASPPTQGRFLTEVWPCQPDPLTPGYPKLQNLNRSLEKKTLLYKNVLNFSRAASAPGWLVLNKTLYSTRLWLANLITMLGGKRETNDRESSRLYGFPQDHLTLLNLKWTLLEQCLKESSSANDEILKLLFNYFIEMRKFYVTDFYSKCFLK